MQMCGRRSDVDHDDIARLDHGCCVLGDAAALLDEKEVALRQACLEPHGGGKRSSIGPGNLAHFVQLVEITANGLDMDLQAHRRLAEHVMNELCRILPWPRQGRTRTEILPGGDFGPDGKAAYEQALRNSFPWLPDRQLARYVQQYGRRTDELLDGASTLNDLGECFGADLYQREVDFLIRTEWAATVEDIIWRRTKVGLRLSAEKRDRLNQYVTGVPRARG